MLLTALYYLSCSVAAPVIYLLIKFTLVAIVFSRFFVYLVMLMVIILPILFVISRLFFTLSPIIKDKYELNEGEVCPDKDLKRKAELITAVSSLLLILITVLWLTQANLVDKPISHFMAPSKNKSTGTILIFSIFFALNLNCIGVYRKNRFLLKKQPEKCMASYFKQVDTLLLTIIATSLIYWAFTCERCSPNAWLTEQEEVACKHKGATKLVGNEFSSWGMMIIFPILFFKVSGNYLLTVMLILIIHHILIAHQVKEALSLNDDGTFNRTDDCDISFLKYYWSHVIFLSALVVTLLYPAIIFLTLYDFRLFLGIIYVEQLLWWLYYLADKDEKNSDFLQYIQDGGRDPRSCDGD